VVPEGVVVGLEQVDVAHRDDGNVVAGALTPADLGGRLVAVHLGHPAVHQHGPVGAALRHRHRLTAVLGDVGVVAEPAEDAHRDDLVEHVVLDQQHATAAARLRPSHRQRAAVGAGGRGGRPAAAWLSPGPECCTSASFCWCRYRQRGWPA
jgi:hypothetical protein